MATCLALWSEGIAHAHPAKASRVFLDVGVHSVKIDMQIPKDELELALEAPAETVDLNQYLSEHLEVLDGKGEALQLSTPKSHWEVVVDDPFWMVQLEAHSPERALGAVTLRDDLVLHKVVSHKIYVSVRSDVFTPKAEARMVGLIRYPRDRLLLERTPASAPQSLWMSGKLGANHILAGADHVLFLLCLLLLATCQVAHGRWVRKASRGQSALMLLTLVTAFTVGHSVTLALGAFDVVNLPPALVEIAVAASLVTTSTHALRPWMPGQEVLFAGGFGLVHGLAFSSALEGLGLPTNSLTFVLLGFNLGIEVAQLMIVAVVAPVLLLISAKAFTWLQRSGAATALLVSLYWTAERAYSALSVSG